MIQAHSDTAVIERKIGKDGILYIISPEAVIMVPASRQRHQCQHLKSCSSAH